MSSSHVTCYLGVPEAARVLGVSRATVLNLINRGELRAARSSPRGPWRIAPADLAAYKRRREMPEGGPRG